MKYLPTLHSLRRGCAKITVVIALIAAVGVFSLLEPGRFLTYPNIIGMVTTELPILILALAMTFILNAGEYDLSMGPAAAFGGILLAYAYGDGITVWWDLLLLVGAGAVLGLIHWSFVYKLGLNALIVTLGTGGVLSGVTLGLSGGNDLSTLPRGLTSFLGRDILRFPISVYMVLGLAFIIWWAMRFTVYGRDLLFIGGGRRLAHLAGVKVSRRLAAAFSFASVIAVLTGVVTASQLASADPTIGSSLLLPSLAAAFLGAATISIGRFNAWGALVGGLFLTVITDGLTIEGASSAVTTLLNGVVLVLAVAFAKVVLSPSAGTGIRRMMHKALGAQKFRSPARSLLGDAGPIAHREGEAAGAANSRGTPAQSSQGGS